MNFNLGLLYNTIMYPKCIPSLQIRSTTRTLKTRGINFTYPSSYVCNAMANTKGLPEPVDFYFYKVKGLCKVYWTC